jgi:hypothetical protein
MVRFTEIASQSQSTSNLIHNENAPIKGIRALPGTAATPSMSFAQDTDTGIFHAGSNTIGMAAGGSPVMVATSSNILVHTDMTFSSNIMPVTNSVQMIGSSNMHFKEAWIDTIHISQNTLYLGGTPVLGTDSNSIAIRADTDQSINLKTTGLGVTNLTSAKRVNVAASGLNSVVDIQSSGTGGIVVIGASNDVELTAPITTISNLSVQGDLTVNGTQFTANVQTVQINDNIIMVNKGQIGSGVSAGYAGIRVDRGDAVDYNLVFNEVTDKFEMGPVGSLVPIATEAAAAYASNVVVSASNVTVSASSNIVYASNVSGYAYNVAYAALPASGGTLTGALTGTGASFDTLGGNALSSSVSSTSSNVAASSAAVKVVYDGIANAYSTAADASNAAVSASSIAVSACNVAYEALPKSGGTLTGTIVSTHVNSLRHVYGDTGVIYRNDGVTMWILKTATNDPYGGWDATFPFRINLSNGDVRFSQNLGVGLSTNPTERLEVNGNIKGTGRIMMGTNSSSPQISDALMAVSYPSSTTPRSGNGALCVASGAFKTMFLNSNNSIMDTCVGHHARNSLRITPGKITDSNYSETADFRGITIDTGGSLHQFQVIASNVGSTLYLNTARKGIVETGSNLVVNGQMFSTGTVSSPSYSFIDDVDTGMYPYAANAVGFAVGGTNRMIVSSNVHIVGNLNATTTVTSSDDRLKSNEQFISGGSLSNILKLRPQVYTKKTKLDHVYDSNQNMLVPVPPPPPRWVIDGDDGTTSNLVQYDNVNESYIESGLIAQEMFYDVPDWRHLVHVPSDANSNVIYTSNIPSSSNPQEDPFGYHQYWGSAPASVNYIGLIPYLVDGIKELASTFQDVNTRMDAGGL